MPIDASMPGRRHRHGSSSLEYGMHCGFAYLGCQYQVASSDRYEWSSHVVNHFKDTPTLLHATCHICNEEFDVPKDTHIKNIWVNRLGHCWEHIQQRALDKNDLSSFLKPGRLLYFDGTYGFFRHAFQDGNGSGVVYRGLIRLNNRRPPETSDNQDLWSEPMRQSAFSSAQPIRHASELALSDVCLSKGSKEVFSNNLILPFRDSMNSGRTQGAGHQLWQFIPVTKSVAEFSTSSRTDLVFSGILSVTDSTAASGTFSVGGQDLEDTDTNSTIGSVGEEDYSMAMVLKQKPWDEAGADEEMRTSSPLDTQSLKASLMDTTSSEWEEETDWDGESSFDSSYDQTRLRASHVRDDDPGSSSLRRQFTSAQLHLIERLMTEFWIVFDHRWQAQPRQRGQASTTPQSTPSQVCSEYTTSGGDARRVKPSKRPRSSENRDSDDEQDRPSKRKGKERECTESLELPIRYACPYRKYNPKKYSIQAWRTCALTPHASVARLKAHLYKYHLIHQCPRCKQLFDTPNLLEIHTLAPEACTVQERDPVDGITNKTREQLQSRKKAFSGQTEADRWTQIYKIIFRPEVGEDIPDPYFEPVHDTEHDPLLSPESEVLAEYEDHFRSELPRHFRQVIESAVLHELQPIEASLQKQLMIFLEEAQKRTSSSFRARYHNRRLLGGSSDAVDPNLDRDHSEQESAAMLETFFEPLPPAETEIEPLALLHGANENAGIENWKHEGESSHDSGYASSSKPSASGYDLQNSHGTTGSFSPDIGESSCMRDSTTEPVRDDSTECKDLGPSNVDIFAHQDTFTLDASIMDPDLDNEYLWALYFNENDNITNEDTLHQ